MTDTKRTIFAGLLIGLLTLSIPFYLNLIGVVSTQEAPSFSKEPETRQDLPAPSIDKLGVDFSSSNEPFKETSPSLFFNIITDNYSAKISSNSGGSIFSFILNSHQKDGYKYLGGYDEGGQYDSESDVNLMFFNSDKCSPCLSYDQALFNYPFELVSPQLFNGETINLYNKDSLEVKMRLKHKGLTINKTTVFYADEYNIKHSFFVDGAKKEWFVVWDAGIKTTENNLYEELTYASAYIGQQKEINNISLSPSSSGDVIEKQTFDGKTDWVAIRNKYFINAFVSSASVGGTLSAVSQHLNNENLVPVYSVGLKFLSSYANINQFFGPLDVDIVASSGTYLDRVMNFGWLPIQPFSRSVLWMLKKLHLVGLNYGIILILFAFLIRFITGPLTKKSYQSTLKMQTIQPQLKKIQEKYKNDTQRLNKEMMKLYQTSGVNPLGGCLPMLIQMPLLFSLFIVFRSTIEFRGAPFFGWINNLSQPDTIFYLPFNIPIYGNQVAFLPILLGVSMFMTQRLSMATMDKNQKPMMYMMSAFFFLLFNSFPSGLNLYYTVYNLLNYQQQRSLKGK
tara:strand:- start:1122 stop:2816 length:1695 start_codon:yes stop_codon:yes gene_type:complete